MHSTPLRVYDIHSKLCNHGFPSSFYCSLARLIPHIIHLLGDLVPHPLVHRPPHREIPLESMEPLADNNERMQRSAKRFFAEVGELV